MGLNGDTVFESKGRTIGYVNGQGWGYAQKRNLRVTVDIRVETLTRSDEYTTTDHRTVTRPLEFALSWGVWNLHNTDIIAGGQIDASELKFTRYVPGFTAAKVAALIKLHSAYHLNGMKAGCIHQTPVYREGRYGREIDLDNTPICPETGYFYGHAWLLEELPADFMAQLRACLPGDDTP